MLAFKFILMALMLLAIGRLAEGDGPRPHVLVRGIYGGMPRELLRDPEKFDDYAINALFVRAGDLSMEDVAALKAHGIRVYAEFNSMQVEGYLKEHPEAAPVGPDGKPSPPPQGWQGICPTHPGYRQERMEAFRRVLADFPIDGIWLDYHHSHASWERADPDMPDTCFCERCIAQFVKDTGTQLPQAPTSELARLLLGPHRQVWVRWRCDLFTDWVRQYKEVIGQTRPTALLGTFHNPWSDTDRQGARMEKLAIDLAAQSRYVDVSASCPTMRASDTTTTRSGSRARLPGWATTWGSRETRASGCASGPSSSLPTGASRSPLPRFGRYWSTPSGARLPASPFSPGMLSAVSPKNSPN